MPLLVAIATSVGGGRRTSNLLCHNSDTFDRMFNGAVSFASLGIDNAPAGIRIFEGLLIRNKTGEFQGNFRSPTLIELRDLVAGFCPWDRESELDTAKEMLSGFDLPKTPEHWHRVYLAESAMFHAKVECPGIAERALYIYDRLEAGMEQSQYGALIHLFFYTAPLAMWNRAELFIQKPFAIPSLLWTLADSLLEIPAEKKDVPEVHHLRRLLVGLKSSLPPGDKTHKSFERALNQFPEKEL